MIEYHMSIGLSIEHIFGFVLLIFYPAKPLCTIQHELKFSSNFAKKYILGQQDKLPR